MPTKRNFTVDGLRVYPYNGAICKKEIADAKIYDLKVLTLISLAVTAAGFIIMLTYNNIYVRYGLLIAVIALALIKRRTIIDTALSLVGKKKEK